MKSPWQSTDEVTRLEALRRYGLLDPSPDHSLDDLTAQAPCIHAPHVLPMLRLDEPGFTRKGIIHAANR